MDKMHVRGHVKAMTEDGTATIVFSVFDSVDQGGDVVMKGAFAKAAASPRLPHFVADHNWSVLARLGKTLAVRETDEGAEADVQFNLEKQVARDVYSDFKFAPDDQEFSFSYEIGPDGAETKDGKRYIHSFKQVFELGPVLVGMHPGTRLAGVKSFVEADLEGSVEALQDGIEDAAQAWADTRYPATAGGMGAWCDLIATYPISAIVRVCPPGAEDEYWQFDYDATDPENVVLSNPVQVDIEQTVVPKGMERKAAVDDSAWDGPAAMSAAANSDDPAAAYRAICAGRRAGDAAVQSSWALPHHKAPGDPPNAGGVKNSLSRLPQTQGLTNAAAAKRHLEAHMRVINPDYGKASKAGARNSAGDLADIQTIHDLTAGLGAECAAADGSGKGKPPEDPKGKGSEPEDPEGKGGEDPDREEAVRRLVLAYPV